MGSRTTPNEKVALALRNLGRNGRSLRFRPSTIPRLVLAICILFILVAPVYFVVPPSTAQATQQAWSMAQHDQAHTSQSPYAGPTTNVTDWSFTVTQPFRFSPVIDSGGIVYALSSDKIYAIGPNGSVNWYARVFDPVASPALGPDGSIYVPSRRFVSAFSSTGQLKWNLTTVDFNEGADLTVSGSGQIYSVNNGVLYSISPSGQIYWTLPTGCVTSSVAIGPGGTLYCGGRQGNAGVVNGIDPHGAIIWMYNTGVGNLVTVSPSVGADGSIYVVASDGTFFALNPVGSFYWEVKGLKTMNAPAAVGPDGTIYIGGPDLLALAPYGFVLWNMTCFSGIGPTCEPFGTMNGLTADANGNLYVASTLGQASRLLAFDGTGNPTCVWCFSPGAPGQTLSGAGAIGQNGLIYLGTYCQSCDSGTGSGRFYALGLQGQASTVDFSETNLPAGQLWSVSVDGQTYVSENQSMSVQVILGDHSWSASLTLPVSAGTRFSLLGPSSGVVTTPGASPIILTYVKQYEVIFSSSPPGSGTTNPPTGWFNSSSTVNINAMSATGYAFGLWHTNTTLLVIANSTSPHTSLLVNGTGSMTAVFTAPPPPTHVDFTIIAGTGGSVSYAYTGLQGVVAPGGSATIVVPTGAGVVVMASPSPGYVLTTWSSSPPTKGYGNLTTVIFRVLIPSSMTAIFSLQSSSTTTTTTSTTSGSTSTKSTSTTQTSTGSTSTSTTRISGGFLGLHLTVADLGLILVALGVILALGWVLFGRRRSSHTIAADDREMNVTNSDVARGSVVRLDG